jgi:hypothetical protein
MTALSFVGLSHVMFAEMGDSEARPRNRMAIDKLVVLTILSELPTLPLRVSIGFLPS